MDMARTVADALSSGRHALVEAGTGVGKSFAYLVPLLEWAAARDETVAVATSTIALQEQLVHTDLPLLARVLPFDVSFVLVKGRGNYLCKRRLEMAVKRDGGLFDEDEALHQLRAIHAWSGSGARQDLPFVPRPDVWDAVRAESGNCLGRQCPHFQGCAYQEARARIRDARLLVLNHDILLADVAMRRSGATFLPKIGALVIDEAHDFEDAAARHLGASVSGRGIANQLGRLWSPKRRSGLLTPQRLSRLRERVQSARESTQRFFNELHRVSSDGQASQALPAHAPIHEDISKALDALAGDIVAVANSEGDVNLKMEMLARARGLRATSNTIDAIAKHEDEAQVRWLERRARATALCQAPVDLGPVLDELMWKEIPTVILTSATLASGDPPSFDFMRKRLGVADPIEKRVGSPFDYRTQVTLTLRSDLPDPSRQAQDFEAALPEAVWQAVQQSDGNAFVLFTSNASLRRCADALHERITEAGYEVLVQGEGRSRSQMLAAFRAGGAVLFGVASFWQGVDVAGDALRHVIVTRLPFEVPTHPLQVARRQRIEQAGGSSFRELSLPVAALRLKQGFGRLIRRRSDSGRVTILDPRVVTKSYGKYLLATLPACGAD